MGILDHARTWHIRTTASPEECIRTFAACLDGSHGAFMGTSWSVTSSAIEHGHRAVATYQGRSGVAAVISALSNRSQQEHDAAIGSELTFVATAAGNGTDCRMAMTRVSKVYLFFTADARFFRAAMNRVARQLRTRDGELELIKN